MLFSERYGHKKPSMLKKDEMPSNLRTRIWNTFYEYVLSRIGNPDVQFINQTYDSLPYEFLDILWDGFFKGNLRTFSKLSWSQRVAEIQTRFEKLQWNEIYDFIEYFAAKYRDRKLVCYIMRKIDTVLKEERAPYCVMKDVIVLLLSNEEREEIEEALDLPGKYRNVQKHLSKAMQKWADRKNPDYANSIKESIHAVEALVEIFLGRKGTLGELIKKLDIHPALKTGFSNLYGWTSDEGGIRHSAYGESLEPDETSARYMLITCSAFVNYCIARFTAM